MNTLRTKASMNVSLLSNIIRNNNVDFMYYPYGTIILDINNLLDMRFARIATKIWREIFVRLVGRNISAIIGTKSKNPANLTVLTMNDWCVYQKMWGRLCNKKRHKRGKIKVS